MQAVSGAGSDRLAPVPLASANGNTHFSDQEWFFFFCAVGLIQAIAACDVTAVTRFPYTNPVHQYLKGIVTEWKLKWTLVPVLRRWLTNEADCTANRPIARNSAAYSLPPAYELRALDASRDDQQAWQRTVERPLRAVLEDWQVRVGGVTDIAFDCRTSLTKKEVRYAALDPPFRTTSVLCFFRNITGLPDDDAAYGYRDVDDAGRADVVARTRLEAFRANLRARFPHNIVEYWASWLGDHPTTDHLPALCARVRDHLAMMLHTARPLPSTEPSLHRVIAQHASRHFIGQRRSLQGLDAYLTGNDHRPLIVEGDRGSGKSALLAYASTAGRHPGAFGGFISIGATAGCRQPADVVRVLAEIIASSLDRPAEPAPAQPAALARWLHQHLQLATAERPLHLFVDGIDQIDRADDAAAVAWLPWYVPDHVKLVVSCAPGSRLDLLKSRGATPAALFVYRLSRSDASLLIGGWLTDHNRTLQPEQKQMLLDKFEASASPLYLRVATQIASRWRSWERPSRKRGGGCVLAESLDDDLRQ